MTNSPYFAAVDLGSNSFHMLIGKLNEGQLEVIDREKEMVQIARGLDEEGNLDSDAKQRALDCLHRFSERLRDIPSEQIRAVGTKTLRSTKKSTQFLREAEKTLGQPIQIISGYEEARLVYTGFSHSVINDQKDRLVIDIGGGSTEFIIGQDYNPEFLESLDLGCVAYTNRYFRSGIPFERSMRNAYMAACAEIESIRVPYRKRGWQLTYGTSGTIKAIGAIVNPKGLVIRKDALSELKEATSKNEGLRDKSFSRLRREVLPAGIAILNAIFNQLKIDELHVSTASLKDGLIFDTVGRFGKSDIRELTVTKLLRRYDIDLDHANRINDMAQLLWAGIKNKLPNIGGVSRSKALRWSAFMHEIGLNISHSGYHQHGYYLLQHSDLAGFGRYEQFIIASLVQMHRKKIKQDQIQHINESARETFSGLLLCLRLAVCFNRRREAFDYNMTLRKEKKGYALNLSQTWLEANPLTHAGLERELSVLENIGVTLKIKDGDLDS